MKAGSTAYCDLTLQLTQTKEQETHSSQEG